MAFLLVAATVHFLVLLNTVIQACFALCGAVSLIGQEIINGANYIMHNGITFNKQIIPSRATIAKTLFKRITKILIQWLIRPVVSMALRATFERIICPVLSMVLCAIHQRIIRPIHHAFIWPVWKVTCKFLKIAASILAVPASMMCFIANSYITTLNVATQIFIVWKAIFETVSVVFKLTRKAYKVSCGEIQFHDILPNRGIVARTLLRLIPVLLIECLIGLMRFMTMCVTFQCQWLGPVLCMAFQQIIRPLLSMALSKIYGQVVRLPTKLMTLSEMYRQFMNQIILKAYFCLFLKNDYQELDDRDEEEVEETPVAMVATILVQESSNKEADSKDATVGTIPAIQESSDDESDADDDVSGLYEPAKFVTMSCTNVTSNSGC